jgi:hypothetical protein
LLQCDPALFVALDRHAGRVLQLLMVQPPRKIISISHAGSHAIALCIPPCNGLPQGLPQAYDFSVLVFDTLFELGKPGRKLLHLALLESTWLRQDKRYR